MPTTRAYAASFPWRPGRGAVLAIAMLVLAATTAWVTPAYAQDGDGGTQSVFSLGAGSRAIGLGRSFVSLVDDASAVYWNPAALRNVQSTQIMGMYMPLFGDFTGADYTYIGVVYPTLSAGAFGLGFQRVATTFDSYDEFSRPTGEGNYSESQIIISYAAERQSRWWLGTLAAGASFKIARQNVDPFSSTSPGVDVGLRLIPDAAKWLSLGVNLQDVTGAQHRLDTTTDEVPMTVMGGLGVSKYFSNGSAIRVLFQVDLPDEADSRLHFGAEYAFAQHLSLRAGFDDGSLSFGVGVTASRYGLDYAMYSRDEAGSSHPVSFTAHLGTSLPEQRQELAERQAREQRELIQATFETRVAGHREEARRMAAAGDYAGALDSWKIVLEYVPDDSEATHGVATAREAILEQQAANVRDVENRAIIGTRFEQGLDFFNEDNFVRARSEWQAILAIDSTHAGALDYLQRTQAKIDEAVQSHMARARTLEEQGRLTEAIAEWNNVQQYDPNNQLARRAVNRIRDRIQNASQDLADAQRRLRIVSLYNDALRLYNDSKYTESLDNLNQLLRLQPDHEDAKRLQALARRKLTPLTDDEKQRIRALYLAGMRFFSQDEYAKAITEWQKILEIDPANDSVQRNIDEARDRLKQIGRQE